MKKLIVANVSFEWELEKKGLVSSFEDFFSLHPLFLQLQFLPFLYGKEDEIVLLSNPPPEGYFFHLKTLGFSSFPKYLLTSELSSFLETHKKEKIQIQSWGYSHFLANFAKRYHLEYLQPEGSIVQKVASKVYHASHLIDDEQALISWANQEKKKKVLKSPYGFAGRGHCIFDYITKEVLSFARKIWKQKEPVVAEIWHQRSKDFSSHFWISKEQVIHELGAAELHNTKYGSYIGNTVWKEQMLPFLTTKQKQESQTAIRFFLDRLIQDGFFGFVCFDHFIYKENQIEKLYPIVEINPRMTMGIVATKILRKIKKSKVQIRYSRIEKQVFLHKEKQGSQGLQGLLPEALQEKGLLFPKQLFLEST